MKKDCKNCIWANDCRSDKPCPYYSPIDESADNEAYYIEDLKVRQAAYKEIEKEFDDSERGLYKIETDGGLRVIANM